MAVQVIYVHRGVEHLFEADAVEAAKVELAKAGNTGFTIDRATSDLDAVFNAKVKVYDIEFDSIVLIGSSNGLESISAVRRPIA